MDEVQARFYPSFETHNTEVLLNNVESTSATVSLTVVPELVKQIRVEPCHPKIMTIGKPKTKSDSNVPGNLHYTITVGQDLSFKVHDAYCS